MFNIPRKFCHNDCEFLIRKYSRNNFHKILHEFETNNIYLKQKPIDLIKTVCEFIFIKISNLFHKNNKKCLFIFKLSIMYSQRCIYILDDIKALNIDNIKILSNKSFKIINIIAFGNKFYFKTINNYASVKFNFIDDKIFNNNNHYSFKTVNTFLNNCDIYQFIKKFNGKLSLINEKINIKDIYHVIYSKSIF